MIDEVLGIARDVRLVGRVEEEEEDEGFMAVEGRLVM